MYIFLLLISLLFNTVSSKHEEVDGHTLYEIKVQDLHQVEVIRNLEARLRLDVWSYPTFSREGVILVPRDLKHTFQSQLDKERITYKVSVLNIKESLDLEDELLAKVLARSNSSSAGLPLDIIHRYEVVDSYLDELANRFPNLAQVVSAGKSFEGRAIKYLRISTTNFQDRSKPVIMIQSLLHAREWITLPVSLHAIHKLLINVTDQDLVNDIDWIIMPIANPDGYEYSHTGSPFWRKNRATGYMVDDICMGVDLNRNFDFLWGTASSDDVCSDRFHGRGPFSEPETQIIRNILSEYRSRLEMYLDIHSFGSQILYSFGTGELPPNALTMHVVGVRMAQAIDAFKWPENRNYVVGNIVPVRGAVASGSSIDYVVGIDVPLPLAYELPAYRNQDNMSDVNGFLVNPDFIEQAGFETWEGIKTGARWVVANLGMKDLR